MGTRLKLGGTAITSEKRKALAVELGHHVTIIPADNTSSELQIAHDAAVAEGLPLNLAGATYDITTPVVLQPGMVEIEGHGATLSGANMVGEHLVRLDAFASQPMFGTRHRTMSGLSIVGPGEAVSPTIAGLLVSGSASSRSPRPSVTGINISGFAKGLLLGDRAYLAQFYSFSIYNCLIGIHQLQGTDSGENISFHGGSIFNCGDYCVVGEDDSTQLFFHGTSFDYTPRIIRLDKGQANLLACHIEGRASGGRDWLADMIDITGDGASFTMLGGAFVRADSNAFDISNIVNVRHVNSYASFENVFMHNLQNTAGIFSTGPGRCLSRGRRTYANGHNSLPLRLSDSRNNGLLIDGDFTTSTSNIHDQWFIATDNGVKPNTKLSSPTTTLTLSTDRAASGTKSLKVEKTTGTSVVVCLYASLGKDTTASGRLQYSSPDAGMNLSIPFDFAYAKNNGNDADGIPDIRTFGVSGSGSVTPDNTWKSLSIRFSAAAPAWADGVLLRFTLPVAAAGKVYIDDINLSEW